MPLDNAAAVAKTPSMTWGWDRFDLRRTALIALALMALSVRILIPQGLMLTGAADDQRLVICTGHGPLIDSRHGDWPWDQRPKADAPCPYVGLGHDPLEPAVQDIGHGVRLTYTAMIAAIVADIAPERGLAAPPPPSQGPPTRL